MAENHKAKSSTVRYGLDNPHPLSQLKTELVCRINKFRNAYVAHQTKDLTDLAMAKAALAEWIGGLRRIWKLHG